MPKTNPTTTNQYFEWLESTIDPNCRLYQTVHTFLEEERRAADEEDDPFLSVVMRTQGKRPHMLTEALLSLTGQSNTDFELLVMGHNLDEEHGRTVLGMLNNLPGWMKRQTRYLPVNGGTRTTPLNEGFSAAKGRYIAVLDDDDIVFDNWVDEFYKLSKEAPGTILHTYPIQQDWEIVHDGCPRAVSAPKKTYCKSFELIRELGVNLCPLLSLAFPGYSFRELGIRFDETLTTTEDWDFLLRTAFLTGVTNKAVTTCIYRNWLNAENSQTLHSKKEWDVNYKTIIQKINATPIILPAGSLKKSIRMITGAYRFGIEENMDEIQLFYDNGGGFHAGAVLSPMRIADPGLEYTVAFTKLSELGELSAIRIDPQEEGGLLLTDLKLEIAFHDGTTAYYDQTKITHNGYSTSQGIAFVKSDPQIILLLDEKRVLDHIYLDYEISDPIPDAIYTDLIDTRHSEPPRSLPYRALRFVWRRIRRVFHS